MATMNYVAGKLNSRRKGTFVRVHYVTDLESKMRAGARSFYKVEKETVCTYKYGCALANVARYKAREEARVEPKKVVTEWARWTTPNVFKENIKTGRQYLSLITVPHGNNAKSKYFMTDRETGKRIEVTKEKLQELELMQPSYWTEKNSETVLIPVENIIDIY